MARVFVHVQYFFVYSLCLADNEKQHTASKNRDMPDPDAVHKTKQKKVLHAACTEFDSAAWHLQLLQSIDPIEQPGRKGSELVVVHTP